MGLYTSPQTRRRRILVAAALGLLLGGTLGFTLGRMSSTTTAEQLASVRLQGTGAATRIEALTIEYEQAAAASGETLQGGVLDPLTSIRRDTLLAVQRALWLKAEDRDALDTALSNVEAAAKAGVTPDEFATVATASAATVRAMLS